MIRTACRALCGAVILIACTGQSQVTEYDLFKVIVYHQTSADALAGPEAPAWYYFTSRVITDPACTTTNLSLATPLHSDYPYVSRSPTCFTVNSSSLASKTDLDTCFPPGEYDFSVSCLDHLNTPRKQSGHLNLPDTNLYTTNIPAFTGDTWNAMRHVDPGISFTLRWNAYSKTPGATSARTFLDVLDAGTGELRFRVNQRPLRNWATIPPNTLAYGHTYTVRMYFSERIVSRADMGFGKAESIVGFDKLLETSLVTVPRRQIIPVATNAAPLLPVVAKASMSHPVDAAADPQAPPAMVREATVPWLQIEPMGTGIQVSWPAAVVNYQLETATDFAPPNTAWSIVTNQPTTDGVTARLLLPASGDKAFFRLTPK
jgi:hypothetical protein